MDIIKTNIDNNNWVRKDGFITLPENDLEEILDSIAFDVAMSIDEEAFPLEVSTSLINGENPITVYRKYRGLNQTELASITGISKNMISEIESSKKNGSIDSLKKIAEALELSIDDIV